MHETSRRAHEAHSLRVRRLDWKARVPDAKEDEDLQHLSAAGTESSWFQVKTSHGFQHPSVVLVEKIISRNDVVNNIRRSNFNSKSAMKPWYDERDKARICIGQKTGGRDINVFQHSSRDEKTRRPADKHHTERLGTEWGHSNQVIKACAKSIEQGLRHDGLGYIPAAAYSLGIIRRMELDADGFFGFLFSNRWKDGCLLRILEGKLQDNLLQALTQMQKYHRVISYSTMAYSYVFRPILPCIKTSTTTTQPEMLKKKLLVVLDYFSPQPPLPDVLIQHIQNMDLSIPFSKEMKSFQSEAETVQIKCNIRGHLKPPPHLDCLQCYHAVPESFMQRRHRQQSAFPHISVPEHRVSTIASLQHHQEKKKSRDNELLGPKLSDNSEVIADDLLLPAIPMTDSEKQCADKTHSFNLNKESTEDKTKSTTPETHGETKTSPVSNKPGKNESQKSAKKGEKNRKRNKKGVEDTSSDEEDDQDKKDIRPYVDPSREKKFRSDLNMMTLDLAATKLEPITMKIGIEKRLRKALLAKHNKNKYHLKKAMQEPAVEQGVSQEVIAEQPQKQSVCTPSSGMTASSNQPYTLPKYWNKCPTFAEFYQYLQEDSASDDSIKKLSRSRILKKDKLGLSANSRASKTESSETATSRDSTTPSINQDTKDKKKRKAAKQKTERGSATKQSTKENQKRVLTPKQQGRTPIIMDGPYVYISDSEIPDNITENALFNLLQVNRHFNPEKLKSSYSFEKLYAHRSHEIPNYDKLLKMFSKPFKPKKPKPPPKKHSAKQKNQQISTAARDQLKDTEVCPQPPVEECTEPMILGYLRDFKFLQQNNFIPDPFSSSNPPLTKNDMSIADISQRLIMAMQRFVVRKERATTTYGTCQYSSKVSLTFSRRPPEDFWLGVPPATALYQTLNI